MKKQQIIVSINKVYDKKVKQKIYYNKTSRRKKRKKKGKNRKIYKANKIE